MKQTLKNIIDSSIAIAIFVAITALFIELGAF